MREEVSFANKNKPKDIRDRTFDFAIQIVKLCQLLDEKPGVPRTISSQILRSGTSIGANIEEAQAGQSKPDFISKNAISLKEAREPRYWLRLLAATEIMPSSNLIELQREIEEIMRIIAAIIVSAKNKPPQNHR